MDILCAGCEKNVEGGEEYMEALGSTWHVRCFRCSWCSAVLTSGFFSHAGKPYCPHDYYAAFAETCFTCGKKIVDEVITASQRAYHRRCFVCEVCKVLLPMSFHNRNGHMFCDAHSNTSIHEPPSQDSQSDTHDLESATEYAQRKTLRDGITGEHYHLKGFHEEIEKELRTENEALKQEIAQIKGINESMQKELSEEKKKRFLYEKQIKTNAEEITRLTQVSSQPSGLTEISLLRERLKTSNDALDEAHLQIDELNAKLTEADAKSKKDAIEIVNKAREITKKAEQRAEDAEKRAAKAEEQLRLVIEKIKSSQTSAGASITTSASMPPPPPPSAPITAKRIPTTAVEPTPETKPIATKLPENTESRSAVLSSISSFDATKLRKTVTIDSKSASKPKHGSGVESMLLAALSERTGRLPESDE